MAEIVRLNEWPFDKDEFVTLWWLRSPWREAVNRQWRITTVFKRESGELKEVDFPWGLIPWLRLGQVFQNGQPIWERTEGQKFQLTVPAVTSATLLSANSIPSLAQYLHDSESNLDEYCVTFSNQKQIVVIPVLECIRAFVIPNKSLAFGLLEPNYFERIITRNEIIADKLSLDFSADIPKSILSKPVVFFIARLLHDPSFRSAWDRVYSDRLSTSTDTNWNTSIPLITNLPALAPNWQVRGLLSGQTLLVQQILEVQPAQFLPFSKLEFTHPGIKKRKYIQRQTTNGQRQRKVVTEYQIDNEAKPPSISKSSASITRMGMSILESQNIKITQAGSDSIIGIKRPADSSRNKNSNLLINQTVNISDVGKGGKNAPAEFALHSRTDIFVPPDEGLDEFAEAIRYLDEIHSEVSLNWEVKQLEKEIIFAKINDNSRKYALVKLTFSSKFNCWILEFGRPDNFSISTLLFTLNNDKDANQLDLVIDKILAEALLPQGGWFNKALKDFQQTINGFNFKLCKHTNNSTEDWGGRLYKNAKEVIWQK